MNEGRIKELFSNEEYVKGLFELGSYEKAAEKLAEDGVEASPEELKKVVELLKKKADGELNDEDLEQVSGGLTLLAAGILAGVGTLAGAAAFSGIIGGLCHAATNC